MNPTADSRPIALIADDDEMTRLMLTEAAGQAKLQVIAVADGETALAIGQNSDFDVALLDVEMPGLDGYSVCRELRQSARARFAPILMITGHDDAHSVDRAYRAGATDFMPKPLNWPLIPHRLRYLLRNAATMRDLDRREAENRALLESIPDRIHLLDAAGNVRRVLREVDGTPAVPLGTIETLIPAEQAKIARRHIAATANDGLPRQHEYSESTDASGPCHYEMRYFHCGTGEVLAMRQDITHRYEQEQRIRQLAYFDSLTGLPNRQLFVERVGQYLDEPKGGSGQAAVLHLDLDGFKRVNETFGHGIGDQVLRAVALKLQQAVTWQPAGGSTTELARFGGDEFVFFLAGSSVHDRVPDIADQIAAAFADPLDVDGRDFFVTPSIGMALYPTHGHDIDSLLKNADTAMYHAKTGGTPRRALYSEAMSARAREWLTLNNHLRRAVRHEQFELYYQPKFRLSDGGMAGAEALLRWFHPELGEISPARFIPLAEESGLILDLGPWVTRAACRQLRHWQDRGLRMNLAINISGKEFMHGHPVDVLRQETAAVGIDPGSLEIEITESVLVNDSARVQDALHDLRRLGCRIALDDFGTGYSSLSYLKRFPPDSLKIDRSFIINVHRDRGDAAILDAVLAMAASLGVEVVAEGIEEPEQLAWLKRRGCTLAQGFLLARPMPAHQLESLLVGNEVAPTRALGAA
jgi:diguanylate cyclase (GGDEF)-like protein